MKLSFIALAIALTALTACNNEGTNTASTATTDSTVSTSVSTETSTPPAGVDAAVSKSIKGIVDGYIHMKNALTKDDAKDAAAAGSHILDALTKVDTAAMNPAQKTAYAAVADDVKEHAKHINENAGKIAHQREHFEMLSKDVEDLVKTFGGGRPLYKTFCPMAFDNKGASWLSEIKEIRNPYFGDDMLECGEVKETL